MDALLGLRRSCLLQKEKEKEKEKRGFWSLAFVLPVYAMPVEAACS
jgi:hypothetical protein